MSSNNELLRLEDINKVFPIDDGELYALKNINLTVNKGDIYGIIGLSGAGKSTLVRCINLLEKPTTGNVWFRGNNLLEMNKTELNEARKSIGMIFQGFNLLQQRTALKNVCFPLELVKTDPKVTKKRALELLEIVGLSDRIKNYPSQLSGGQQQRVAIARALATNPDVLLCDEATSALDPNTTDQILNLLKEINQKMGVTIIIITHEMKIIEKVCSHVAVLDNGEIAESGPVSQVFGNPQSAAARNLIMPLSKSVKKPIENFSNKCIRILFDGKSSFEPVVSNMVLECKAPVNILYANTKDISGQAVGQMLLQLPDDLSSIERIMQYLKNNNVTYQEETTDAI